MGLLSPILRNVEGGGLMWWCPGCDGPHCIQTGEGPGPRWGWNGDALRPTFTPSVLVQGVGLTPAGQAQADAWFEAGCPQPAPKFENQATVCHSFVTDGQMQMLSDCTHALAGQTVPIPPWQPDAD
ncbi:DUF6527 family protein [Aquincola tertiaricarbonis]|uniref:DUF6527 family protein n=1 Tax=Aquincola tertiaricarbonis TaxID=391953 RepID=A0ABY4S613_AQUTE|nr:DUF6527 family protein [Aquincola tertiaricarbonis]URI08767.1 DUF6527 family protein [Aquincola tertiaricarbonis]